MTLSSQISPNDTLMSEAIKVNMEGIGLVKEILFELFLLFLHSCSWRFEFRVWPQVGRNEAKELKKLEHLLFIISVNIKRCKTTSELSCLRGKTLQWKNSKNNSIIVRTAIQNLQIQLRNVDVVWIAFVSENIANNHHKTGKAACKYMYKTCNNTFMFKY